MKAINLIKNNIFTLLNSGCSNNEIYEAIQELEALEIKLKQGQDNYNKLWDMYSELKKENKELEEEMRNLTTELILNMLKENK